MDRKSIILLVAAFCLLLTFNRLVNSLFPPVESPIPSSTAVTNQEAGPSPIPTGSSNTSSIPSAAPALHDAGSLRFVPASTPEEIITVETKEARYHFTTHGGGLKFVELKKYPATVLCGREAQGPTNQLATLNQGAPAPILALLGNGGWFGDGEFKASRIDGGVRMEKVLTNGLRLANEFRITTNYVVAATQTIENSSGRSFALPEHELVTGTSTPIGLTDESRFLGFLWFNGAKAEEVGEFWFANKTLGCFPGTPRSTYESGASNVFWAAAYNQYFAIAAIPSEPVLGVVGRRVDLPPPTEAELAQDSRNLKSPYGHQASFRYASMTLAPGARVERTFDLYAGPKEYNTLAKVHSDLKLDNIMRFGFFGLFAKGLLLAMNGLYALGIPYGLVIVVLTIIIRLILWPFTTASTRSMKRMAALQPQMKAIQEKFKDDPKKVQLKMMEFMKENKVSPLGGCLPMLLQLPVFIGFFTMLQSAIELRGASFLWACDLSQTDTIFVIPGLGLIPFFGIPGLGLPLNPLPLLMGGTQLWQAHLMPPSPGMDPVQQKMMRYMPLLLVLFMYNYSAGLSLYWTVGNLLSIAQVKLTKTDEPAKPTPASAVPKKSK